MSCSSALALASALTFVSCLFFRLNFRRKNKMYSNFSPFLLTGGC
jgi:hypothetical protein